MKFLMLPVAILATLSCSKLERLPAQENKTKVLEPVIANLPAKGQFLYKMGRFKVWVMPGDVERIEAHRRGSHEMDTEHSGGDTDPSILRGYHFATERFVKQTSVAVRTAGAQMVKSPAIAYKKLFQDNHKEYSRIKKTRPEQFELFELNSSRYLKGAPQISHSPVLVNSDYEFTDISDRHFGYCWGFATMNRYFTQLAFFDKDAMAPAYKMNGLWDNKEWFEFYQKIIDEILEGQAQVIPGFANFREFTQIPEIEFYLKLRTMDLWSHRAITFGALETFFTSTKPMSKPNINRLVSDLKARLERHELPKILFTAMVSSKILGGSVDVHSVIVTGVEQNPDGTGKIDLWDINFYAEDYLKSPKFIEIRQGKDGLELHYGPWFEKKETEEATYLSSRLGEVRVAPENDAENAMMLKSLRKFCSSKVSTASYCQAQN
jgi:hypothetical protein